MASNFFISASGSSGNSGLSSLLPKNSYANALSVSAAGDTFSGHGGDTFRETVLARFPNQTFNAYGTGKPIISGANVVGPFAAASSPRYSTAVSSTVRILFVNGTRATQGSSATTLGDGEWWWAAGALYYRSDAGNPTTLGLTIEAGQRDYCINQNSQAGISVLSTRCQYSQHTSNGAIYFQGTGQTTGFVVDHCDIWDHYSSGMVVHASSAGATVTFNDFRRCGQHGAWWDFSVGETNQVIDDNTFTDCGWRSTGDNFVSAIIGAFRSGECLRNVITNQGVGGSGGHAHGIYGNSSAAAGGAMRYGLNIVNGAPNGFGLKLTQDGTVDHNVFTSCTWGGANLGQNDGANNCTILFHHNTISLCSTLGGAGVDIKNAGSSGTLTVRGYHNTTYENSGSSSGGEVNVETDLALFDWRNNIHFATNNASAKYIQMVTQSGTVTIDYQDYFNSSNTTPFRYGGAGKTFTQWKALGFGPDVHAITSDPTFTSPGTGVFTLQSGSLAINAGVAISGINDGFVGAAPDMGANEADFSGSISGTGASAMGGVAVSGSGTVAGAGAGGSTMAGVAVAGTGTVSLSVTGTASATLGGVRVAGSGTVAGTTVLGGTPLPTPFLFPPNWETPLEMTSTWKTDVLQGENGTEQRVSMRDGPSDSMKYAAQIQSQADAGALALLLAEEPTGRFNMPRWADATLLTANVSIGGTSLSCDTTDRAFVVGGLALIWRRASGVHEVRKIAGLTGSAIDLTGDPATLAWTGNTDVEVLPIAPAWLTLPLARTYVGGVLAEVQIACEWEAAELPAIGPTASVAATVVIGADADGTGTGNITYGNIFLNGSYLIVHAEVLDADAVEIPEAPVTWTLADPVTFSVQPVGLYGETAILKNVSAGLTGTTTLTATSGSASTSRTVVA